MIAYLPLINCGNKSLLFASVNAADIPRRRADNQFPRSAFVGVSRKENVARACFYVCVVVRMRSNQTKAYVARAHLKLQVQKVQYAIVITDNVARGRAHA